MDSYGAHWDSLTLPPTTTISPLLPISCSLPMRAVSLLFCRTMLEKTFVRPLHAMLKTILCKCLSSLSHNFMLAHIDIQPKVWAFAWPETHSACISLIHSHVYVFPPCYSCCLPGFWSDWQSGPWWWRHIGIFFFFKYMHLNLIIFSSPTASEIWCAEDFSEITPYFHIAIEVCNGNYEYLSYLASQVSKQYLPYMYTNINFMFSLMELKNYNFRLGTDSRHIIQPQLESALETDALMVFSPSFHVYLLLTIVVRMPSLGLLMRSSLSWRRKLSHHLTLNPS